jgi:hypothetical protein
MLEFKSVVKPVPDCFGSKNSKSIDDLALSVKCLHDNLLSIWLQEHVYYPGSIALIQNLIFVVHHVVDRQAGQEDQGVAEHGHHCDRPDWHCKG